MRCTHRMTSTVFLSSGIGVIFAFMYWISAEKILIALRKLNAERTRVRIPLKPIPQKFDSSKPDSMLNILVQLIWPV